MHSNFISELLCVSIQIMARYNNPMETIDKAVDQHYGTCDGKFYLWVDRQIRPTIGASAKKGV